MPKTANNLMSAVAGFLQRDRAVFNRAGVWDNLLQACNNARLQTERLIDFELSRVSVQVLNVSLTTGGSLTSATLLDGTTAVAVKKIIYPFLTFVNGVGSFPIDLMSRDRWLDRQHRRFVNAMPTDQVDKILQTNAPLALVQQANTIYVVPADSRTLGGDTITVYLDVYKWLPSYGATTITGSATSTTANKLVATAGSFITNLAQIGAVVTNTTTGATALVVAVDSATSLTLNSDIFVSGNAYSIVTVQENDFLLDYCFDWLMYAAVEELNFFLKEDERVAISKEVTQRAWEGVVRWNTNFIKQGVNDTNLD